MKKILFQRSAEAYLPEIPAYLDYIHSNLPDVRGYDSLELNEDVPQSEFDVIWKFMGIDRKKIDRLIIHEYASLSVGQFSSMKDSVKRLINIQPSGRVFLNQLVADGMAFKDEIPYKYRDMGVHRSFFRKEGIASPHYDFVYAGSLDRGKTILSLLNFFKNEMRQSSLLIIGSVPDHIHNLFGNAPNIIFTGRIPYMQVPSTLMQARCGINIMPDTYPFNLQTSTKLLEYCAAGLPIITSDYKWVRDFEKKNNGKFFYLDDDFKNFTQGNIENFNFNTPTVTHLEWENIIKESQVFDLI